MRSIVKEPQSFNAQIKIQEFPNDIHNFIKIEQENDDRDHLTPLFELENQPQKNEEELIFSITRKSSKKNSMALTERN